MDDASDIEDLIGNFPEPPGVLAGLTREEREDEFFRLLAQGCQVRTAAAAVAMDWSHLYRKRREDEVFAKRWEDASRIKVGHLIAEAERRAMLKSDKLLIFLLSSYDPARFRHQSTVDVTNSDGTLVPQDDAERASRAAALFAVAAARRSSQDVTDLL